MPWRSIDSDTLARFLRETASATWATEGDGYVLDMTEWTALTGQSAEEAEGDGWLKVVHPDDVDRVNAAWQTSLAHGAPYNSDYRLRCADGLYRWFNVRGLPVLGPNGETRRWIGVILAIPGQSRPSRSPAPSTRLLADRFEDISPAALRAARAMLNWPAERLAEEAGVARSTLRRLEDDDLPTSPRRESMRKILQTLADQGVQCVGHAGRIVGIIDPAFGAPE